MQHLRLSFITVLFLMFFFTLVFGQTDIDNTNNYVVIGTQVWMSENLKTTKYRNGDPIPNVTDNIAWSQLTSDAYCNYDNNPANGVNYGRLYNWYAINDPRGLAPSGWHLATDAEWTILINYLGGETVAGEKLKEAGFAQLGNSYTNSSNDFGFTALPGGYRGSYDGTFYGIGYYGCWWSSMEFDAGSAWYRYICYGNNNASRFYDYKNSGYSVRCIKD
jgi:uncharacterized protein (TIGR02145 family)